MAYSKDEADRLKSYMREIIKDEFLSILHELKKKLTLANSKQQEQAEKLERFEREVAKFEKCHECHRLNVKFRDVSTQTLPIDDAVGKENPMKCKTSDTSNPNNKNETNVDNQPQKQRESTKNEQSKARPSLQTTPSNKVISKPDSPEVIFIED